MKNGSLRRGSVETSIQKGMIDTFDVEALMCVIVICIAPRIDSPCLRDISCFRGAAYRSLAGDAGMMTNGQDGFYAFLQSKRNAVG